MKALRSLLIEKVERLGVDVPPLCSCGENIWDTHPDLCANNCPFYKNPKGMILWIVLLRSPCIEKYILSSIILRLTQKQTETFPLNKYDQSSIKWSHCDTKAFHATVTIPPPHDIDIHHHLFYVIFLQDMRGQYKLCWRHAISVIDMKSCKQCRVVTCTVLLIPSFLPCTMCIIVVNQHVFIWNLFCLNELLTSLSHVVFNVSVIFLSANDLLTAGTSFYPCDWEWLFCAIFW